MRVIGVPSGVGDISWMWSKLRHIEGKLKFEVAGQWPARAKEFLDCFVGLEECDYDETFCYEDIINFEQAQDINKRGETWKNLSNRFDSESRLLLQANRHLEMGHPLEDWLPDLPCDFHYPIVTKDIHKVKAAGWLESLPRPIIGVSAASYRGAEAWKTWKYDEWSPFLKWLLETTKGSVLLIGGHWDDLTHSLAVDGHRDSCGKTDGGTSIELLRNVDLYVGFSSGLGILRTVMNKPAFMMWPKHQVALSTSWAPPAMLRAGTYACSQWETVPEVQRHVKLWLDCAL